jgi:cytochrome c peroxidase
VPRWRCQAALAGALLATACGDPSGDTPSAPAERKVDTARGAWTPAELSLLDSLSLAALRPPPPDPSNRVADLPEAAELGHRLFFDPRLSANGRVACATCHVPALLFTDGRATSRGLADTPRNAPTLVGAAHSPWMFWDGRRDSLWAQALGPIETAAEMGSTRVAALRHVAAEGSLRSLYERVFRSPPLPGDAAHLPERAGPGGSAEERAAWRRLSAADRRSVDQAFANLGKAIAAYERQLQPGPSRFDRYVAGLRNGDDANAPSPLHEQEIHGLRLFLDAGRTQCLRCHNGPLLTNQSFHRVGTADGRGGVPDFGRFLGVQAALIDPFNCLGDFSDARPEQCGELRFLNRTRVADEMGKFKTPTLRGLPRTGPYMHDGRFTTLDQVVEHYRRPPAGGRAPLEITPIEIDDREARALAAFLASLDGGVDAAGHWTRPPGGMAPTRPARSSH